MISIILALVLASPVSLTSTQTVESRKVEKRLLAPCCYAQSIVPGWELHRPIRHSALARTLLVPYETFGTPGGSRWPSAAI